MKQKQRFISFLLAWLMVATFGYAIAVPQLQDDKKKTHEPAERWYKENGEEGKLPTDADQCNEIEEDQDRVLEEHVERRHDAVLHFLHITALPS